MYFDLKVTSTKQLSRISTIYIYLQTVLVGDFRRSLILRHTHVEETQLKYVS